MACRSFEILTTTEKLLVATAFELYGESNIQQITKFLRFHDLILDNLTEIFLFLKRESEDHGYKSVKKYCQDLRSHKALLEYEKYKKLIYAVLENKIDVDTIEIPEFENFNIGKQPSVIKKTVNETVDINFITDNVPKIETSPKEQPQIEPKNLNKNIRIKVESPKNVKEKKRFYLRMDEEEKIIDDYFDYLDVKNLEGERDKENLEKVSDLLESHPLLNKIKEKRDKTVRSINNDDVTKREKIETILTPFDQICHKIQSTKRQEKDKAGWKSEIKIIVEYFSGLFGKHKDYSTIIDNYEIYSLQYTIMSIMLIIQDYIIEEEDEDKLDEYSEYKRKLAAFCDYYKK